MAIPEVWNLFGEHHLPYRLLLLSRMIDRETQRQLMEGHGLSLAEWRLLAIANAIGPTTASRIGVAGQIDRAEISRALGKLEKAGLLARAPDPNHGKRQILSATPAGMKLYEKISAERRAYYRDITADLDPTQRAGVEMAIAAIAERVAASEGED